MSRRACVMLLAVFASGSSTASPEASAMFERALSAYAGGDASTALALAEQAYSLDETLAPACNLLGTIWRESGSARGRTESERWLELAVARSPDSAAYAVNLARTRLALGKLGSARRILEDLLSRDRNCVPAHVLLGDVLAADGLVVVDGQTLGRALGEYLEAVKRNPRESNALAGICRLLGATGRWREAMSYIPAAIAASVDDHELYLLAGAGYARMGDFQAAARSFNSAFALGGVEERDRFADPSPVLETSRLARWQALDASDCADSVRVFWRAADSDLTTPESEALLIHQARLVEADLRFGVVRLGLAGRDTDRGKVYVRYGQPAAVAFERRDMTTPWDDSGDNVGGFGPMTGIGSYGGGSQYDPGARQGAPLGKPPTYIWVYADPPCTLSFADYSGAGEFVFPFRSDDAYNTRETVSRLRERRPWVVSGPAWAAGVSLAVDAFCFRGDSDESEVTVVASFPFSELAYRVREGQPVVELVRRFSFDDPGWTSATFLSDTSRVVAAAAIGDQPYGIVGRRSGLSPGRYVAAVAVYDPLTGRGGYSTTELSAREFPPGVLSLSDVVIATKADSAVAPGPFVWGEYVYQPLLTRQDVKTKRVHLYYEVYSLGLDDVGSTRYRATYRVLRLTREGGMRPMVSSTFEFSGITPDEAQAIAIDLSKLKPGDYEVGLLIEDAVAKRQARASRRFTLLE